MPNLIVMPGSKEFEETLAKVKVKKPAKVQEAPVDLVGRTLMLNTAISHTFQCGGFHLGTRHPVAIVTEQAQQAPLHAGLATGQLIDVTGKDLTKGYKGKGGETSAITEEDTGKKVFVARDRRGNIAIVAPKSKAESKRFERELRETGTLKTAKLEDQFSGFSGIVEEELEPAKKTPAKKPAAKAVRKKNAPAKKKANVSSSSRSSRS